MISMHISCRNNLVIYKLVTLYIMLNPRYVCSIENKFNMIAMIVFATGAVYNFVCTAKSLLEVLTCIF